MILSKRRVYSALVFMAVLATAAVVGQNGAYADSNSANVIKIAPVRTDVTADPGTTKTVDIEIINPTNNAIKVTPIENDFVSADENGTPSLILDANQYAPTHSLKRFMSPLSPVTIAAGKSATVEVKITIPKDAQAGGYFGAVRFTPTAVDNSGQVNLSANAASIILLTVSGPVTEKLALTDFDIQQNGKAALEFRNGDNLTTYIRFENKGNIQEAPFGSISVTQGKKVVYETQFNTTQPRDEILPDGARKWEVPLKNVGTFGKYTVTATLSYGQKNQTIQVSKSFWVIPWFIIIAAIIALLVIIGLVVGIWLFLRGYKRRILRNSGYRRR